MIPEIPWRPLSTLCILRNRFRMQNDSYVLKHEPRLIPCWRKDNFQSLKEGGDDAQEGRPAAAAASPGPRRKQPLPLYLLMVDFAILFRERFEMEGFLGELHFRNGFEQYVKSMRTDRFLTSTDDIRVLATMLRCCIYCYDEYFGWSVYKPLFDCGVFETEINDNVIDWDENTLQSDGGAIYIMKSHWHYGVVNGPPLANPPPFAIKDIDPSAIPTSPNSPASSPPATIDGFYKSPDGAIFCILMDGENRLVKSLDDVRDLFPDVEEQMEAFFDQQQ